MIKLGHPITLKKCFFCKTNIEFKVYGKMGLLEYKCVCGKGRGFADEFDMNRKSTIQMIDYGE